MIAPVGYIDVAGGVDSDILRRIEGGSPGWPVLAAQRRRDKTVVLRFNAVVDEHNSSHANSRAVTSGRHTPNAVVAEVSDEELIPARIPRQPCRRKELRVLAAAIKLAALWGPKTHYR